MSVPRNWLFNRGGETAMTEKTNEKAKIEKLEDGVIRAKDTRTEGRIEIEI